VVHLLVVQADDGQGRHGLRRLQAAGGVGCLAGLEGHPAHCADGIGHRCGRGAGHEGQRLSSRRLREGRFVPFGPFLAGGGLVVMLTGLPRVLEWMGW